MFAIEISFADGVSKPEMILVRRPQALIGASEQAHVVIDDMQSLNYQLRIIRGLGRRFRCKPVGVEQNAQLSNLFEGVYEGETTIDTGPVKLCITALDSDLVMKEGEPPDRAGVRVMRQVCSMPAPKFPAAMVPGADPIVVSFAPDQAVFVGRSNRCAVRLDASDVSAKHARFGFESGQFWVEDLGSTNGTFVKGQQISGRVNVEAGSPVVVGRELSVLGVISEEQVANYSDLSAVQDKPSAQQTDDYPALISLSEVARPARLVIPLGSTISIGRDPGSDVWLGAPHISRSHCALEMSKTGKLLIRDLSTNGTAYDGGILKKGDALDLTDAKVLNFGGGITVAICFSAADEQVFISTQGSPHAFISPEEVARLEEDVAVHRDPGTQALLSEQVEADRSAPELKKQGVFRFFRKLPFAKKLVVIFMAFLFTLMVAVVVSLIKPIIF